jgi:hypothetical protein
VRHLKVQSPDGNGSYNITELGNVEFADPIKFYSTAAITGFMATDRNLLQLKGLPYHPDILEPILQRRAIKDWTSHFNQLMTIEIPDVLIKLLNTPIKKDQLKLLKNITFTTYLLQAYIFKAFLSHGFLFSHYVWRHNPSGVDSDDIPTFAYKDKDSKIIKVGETNLTDGQIKAVIEQRHVVNAKFLDKGNIWHCFFTTYKSLKGEENGGIPHLHYISSGFGRSREEVIYQLQRKNYKLPRMPHILYTR